MITLNNNNLEITEGLTTPNSGKMLSSPSVTPELDDNMPLINNRMLKGTDWFITPTRNYIKTIKGLKATISKRSQYISRRGNNYKTTYNVTLGDSFLGTRRKFKDAMKLAEGGK